MIERVYEMHSGEIKDFDIAQMYKSQGFYYIDYNDIRPSKTNRKIERRKRIIAELLSNQK
jgi:hypothetical protein